MKSIKTIIINFSYFLLWVVILLFYFIGLNEGIISVFKDAFGIWVVWFGWIMALISFFSFVYLRIFTKNKPIIYLLAYGITILFCICSLILLNIGNRMFSEFTTDKWTMFPEQRINMYFDLEKNYNIIGYTYQSVENLLGEPDTITNDNTYVYEDKHDNAVYVKFKDNKVIELFYIE